MRWQDKRRSSNVDDRRGQSVSAGGAGVVGLALRFLPFLLRSKIGRIILGVGVVGFFGAQFLGIDLMPLLGQPSTGSKQTTQLTAEQQAMGEFVAVVLADTEDTWNTLLPKYGATYQEPTLVLFSAKVNSACGLASAAVGPFYCPGDQKLYIDLSFYKDLKTTLGAPGDFAQAYVIAHEVGHHIQNLLGTSAKMRQDQQGLSKAQANKLSVKLELQADCYAGVWGYYANTERQLLEEGDLNEALVAASAIGDDRLQSQAGGQVVPDSFTHGTSEQRVKWFKQGFTTGEMTSCNTFEQIK